MQVSSQFLDAKLEGIKNVLQSTACQGLFDRKDIIPRKVMECCTQIHKDYRCGELAVSALPTVQLEQLDRRHRLLRR